MPESQPEWTLLQCPECATVSKFDQRRAVAATCPTCSARLPFPDPIPDPNLLPDEEDAAGWEADVVAHDPPTGTAAASLAGTPLIAALGAQRPADPQLDSARLKRTTDEDLASAAEARVRIKRQSRRMAKELTSWDENSGSATPSSDAPSYPRRRAKRLSAWLKAAKIAAIAAVPVALVCLTIYGVIASLKEKPDTPREPELTEAELARAGLSDLEAAALDRDRSKEIFWRARQVAEYFLDATSWEERLSLVRDPERVRPLMKAYYADPRHPDGPFAHRELPDEGKMIVNESLLLFAIETEEGEPIPLALERISDKEFLVDWESFVGYSDIPWDEIPARRPTEPFLLRAKVKERDYYNYGFRDDRWLSLQLEDRASEHRLFGYVERSGSLRGDLLKHFVNSKTPTFLMLRVRFPENAPSGDQLEITEVIAKGWVNTSAGPG